MGTFQDAYLSPLKSVTIVRLYNLMRLLGQSDDSKIAGPVGCCAMPCLFCPNPCLNDSPAAMVELQAPIAIAEKCPNPLSVAELANRGTIVVPWSTFVPFSPG